jgi:Tat protein translocase TatB subunit
MDILGIGFPELLFIFFIALMVFGPRRLPEIAGKAGRIVRDLRNMSQGFLAEWQREITVAARLDELEEVRKELEETKQSLRQSQAEITSGANQIGQSITAVARPTNTAPTTSPAKPAETISKTPETADSEVTAAPSASTPLTQTVDPGVESPLLGEEADAASAVGPVDNLPIETPEIPSEPPTIEKNGSATGIVSKPVPAPVSSTEAAE